jgi:hypothetical protein
MVAPVVTSVTSSRTSTSDANRRTPAENSIRCTCEMGYCVMPASRVSK